MNLVRFQHDVRARLRYAGRCVLSQDTAFDYCDQNLNCAAMLPRGACLTCTYNLIMANNVYDRSPLSATPIKT